MRSVRVEGEETGTVIDHETTTSTDEQVVRDKWWQELCRRCGELWNNQWNATCPHCHAWPRRVIERIRKEQP